MGTRTRLMLFLATLPVVATLLWVVTTSSSGPSVTVADVELAQVRRDGFLVSVRAVGELEPLNSTTIFSEVPGDRGKIVFLVDDGAEVVQGDMLVRFDPTPFEAEKLEAELAVMLAESSLEASRQLLEWEKTQAEHKIQTAAFELEIAKLDFEKMEKGEGPLEVARLEGDAAEAEEDWDKERGYLEELEALVSQGYVNDAEVEQVRKRADKARRASEIARRKHEAYRDYIQPVQSATLAAKIERAEMELEQTRLSTGFKVGEGQAAFVRAERELDSARVRLDNVNAALAHTEIRAPSAGMVVHREDYRGGEKRKPRVGDAAWQNQPLLYLPDLSVMLVRTRVREIDLHKIEVGMETTVRVDALPSDVLKARLRSIGILAERREEVGGAEKYFRIDVVIETRDPRLRPGMTARVDILARAVEDAVVIPIHAIWRDDEERSFAYVAGEQGFTRREVRLGAANDHVVEVLAGLAEGQFVALSPPDPRDVLDADGPETP